MEIKIVSITPVEGVVLQEQTHIVDLPPLCPHTHNPLAGSMVVITYAPVENQVLEVYNLTDYVHSFTGSQIVRDIEHFAQVVAADCGNALKTDVRVTAEFILNIGQRVRTVAVWKKPT
jgi:7-cyano-7-deazaguanine reductase